MIQDLDSANPLHRLGELDIDNWDFIKEKFTEKTYEQAVNRYIDFINTDDCFNTPTWFGEDGDMSINLTKKRFKKLILKDLKRYKNLQGKWYSEAVSGRGCNCDFIIGIEVDAESYRIGGLKGTVTSTLEGDEADITNW